METQPTKLESPSTAKALAILRAVATVFTFLGRDRCLRAGSRAKRSQSAAVMGARSTPCDAPVAGGAVSSLCPMAVSRFTFTRTQPATGQFRRGPNATLRLLSP